MMVRNRIREKLYNNRYATIRQYWFKQFVLFYGVLSVSAWMGNCKGIGVVA